MCTSVRLYAFQEREEERKAAAFREQMLAGKGLTIDQLQSPKKKVVYNDRKKKRSNIPKPAEVDETTQASNELESTGEQKEQSAQPVEPTTQEQTVGTETEAAVSENRAIDSSSIVIAKTLQDKANYVVL